MSAYDLTCRLVYGPTLGVDLVVAAAGGAAVLGEEPRVRAGGVDRDGVRGDPQFHPHPGGDLGRRLIDIRDNLIDRIAEAECEGWLGEVEGLRVSLAGAQSKLNPDRRPPTPNNADHPPGH